MTTSHPLLFRSINDCLDRLIDLVNTDQEFVAAVQEQFAPPLDLSVGAGQLFSTIAGEESDHQCLGLYPCYWLLGEQRIEPGTRSKTKDKPLLPVLLIITERLYGHAVRMTDELLPSGMSGSGFICDGVSGDRVTAAYAVSWGGWRRNAEGVQIRYSPVDDDDDDADVYLFAGTTPSAQVAAMRRAIISSLGF